jgi:hypothetical protein
VAEDHSARGRTDEMPLTPKLRCEEWGGKEGKGGGRGADRDDFAEDADGGQAREPGEVHGRLRVAVAAQDSARHGAEREDVPRPREVARGAARVR